jgi:uncharacterized RDD family membrane protein YckC
MKKLPKVRTYKGHETARMQALEGVRLAPFRSRAGAFAVDFTLAVISLLIFAIPIGTWVEHHYHRKVNIDVSPESPYGYIAIFFYFGLSLYWGQGRTLGKRLFKIRVVSLLHEHLSIWHCFERALGYGASLLEGGFGFLQYFTDPNCRTVHDRIAGTIVVDDRPGPP